MKLHSQQDCVLNWSHFVFSALATEYDMYRKKTCKDDRFFNTVIINCSTFSVYDLGCLHSRFAYVCYACENCSLFTWIALRSDLQWIHYSFDWKRILINKTFYSFELGYSLCRILFSISLKFNEFLRISAFFIFGAAHFKMVKKTRQQHAHVCKRPGKNGCCA